ncbi:hypothetical protein ACTJKX_35380 [Labrys sp. 22185]
MFEAYQATSNHTGLTTTLYIRRIEHFEKIASLFRLEILRFEAIDYCRKARENVEHSPLSVIFFTNIIALRHK